MPLPQKSLGIRTDYMADSDGSSIDRSVYGS
jgi:hypothetical protein